MGKNKWIGMLILAVLPCLGSTTGAEEEAGSMYDAAVGIWYTVWWDAPGEPFFEHHWLNETRVNPVEDGYYASDDPEKIRRDLRYLKRIGIDYLILDDTNCHGADDGSIARAIEAIVQAIDEMGDDAPRFAFAAGAQLHLGRSPVAMQQEADIFFEYYEKYPDRYFAWKGKPLLVLFTSPEWYGWNDSADRFTKRLASGRTSEGLPVADQHGLDADGMYGWVFTHQFADSEVHGLTPGFSRSHNGLIEFKNPISRENGGRYIQQWLQALKRKPEMIVISSWNDHAEETGIEAVRLLKPIAGRANEDPFLYQRITEAYLALQHGMREGDYYQREGSDAVWRFSEGRMLPAEAPPVAEPLIVLPEDWAIWKEEAGAGG